MPELVDQDLAGGLRDERIYDLSIRYVRGGVALLGETPDVVAEGFPCLLPAALEISCRSAQ